eukprot:UN07091
MKRLFNLTLICVIVILCIIMSVRADDDSTSSSSSSDLCSSDSHPFVDDNNKTHPINHKNDKHKKDSE